MRTIDVVALSALVVILSAASDYLGKLRDRRKTSRVERLQSDRNEIEIRGMVIEDVRDTTALQSAMLLDMRTQMMAMKDELAMKNLEVADLQKSQRTWESEKRKLYAEIYQLQKELEELRRTAHGQD